MINIKERNDLVEKYLPLAKKIADRRYGRINKVVRYDDVLSAAHLGLIDAASKYDVNKSHNLAKRPFEAYASVRIFGSINDYLRTCNWGRRQHNLVPSSIECSLCRNNDSNSRYDNDISIKDSIIDKEVSAIDKMNREDFFAKLIKCLPAKEKKAFRLKYIHGMTMKEIADILDVCESRISQILSCALEQLKKTWENRVDELYDNVNA